MADQPPPTPPAPQTSQSTSSYIYPVRSLLSGIQPAPEPDPSSSIPPEPNLLVASLRKDAQARAERQAQQPPSSSKPVLSPGISARRGVAPQGTLPIQRGALPFMRDESFFSAPLPVRPESASPTFFSAVSTQDSLPLSRRQSAPDQPESPPMRRVMSGLEHRDQPATPTATVVPDPTLEAFRHYPAEGREGFHRLAHHAPSTAPTPSTSDAPPDDSEMPVMMHDSVDGAIIRSSVHGSKASATGTGSGTGTGSNVGTESNASVHDSSRPSHTGSARQSGTSSAAPAGSGSSGPVALRSSSASLSDPSASTSSRELLTTVRFQHIQDEHGNHVVVGREGLLARCEDEPIRVPGAVQGFGVLIALEEDYETGNLVVRQVSEVRDDVCLGAVIAHFVISAFLERERVVGSYAQVSVLAQLLYANSA